MSNPDYIIGEIELTTYWELRIVNIFIVATLLIVLCAIHSHRVLADYKLQKVLGDDVGNNFQKIALCTVSSIFFYTLSMIINIFKSWTVTVTKHEKDCEIIYSLAYYSYLTGKLLMFYVFLLRVKISYDGSVYAYDKKIIWFLAVFAFLCTYGIAFVSQSSTIYFGFSLAYFGLPNAALCVQIMEEIPSAMMLWTEFSLSVVCVLLFVIPLYKLLKLNAAFTHSGSVENGKDSAIEQAAYKTTILTATAVLSTSLMYFTIKWIDTMMGALLYPFDSLINVLSLMLMTKYYDKSKWLSFNTLCCCCNYNVLFKCCKINITGKSQTELVSCTSSSSLSTAAYKENNSHSASFYCEGCCVRVSVEGRVITKGMSTEISGQVCGTICSRNANGSGGHKMVQVVQEGNTVKMPKSSKATDLTHTASIDAISVTPMTSRSVHSATPVTTNTAVNVSSIQSNK